MTQPFEHQPPVKFPSWEYSAPDEAGTDRLGAALGTALAHGGVVALVGNLGAGKTRLVRSIAEALGADRQLVNSPTFILIQEYTGRNNLPIYHCDTYRLRNVDEFLDLGTDELFTSEAVCLVEWADRVAPVLPADRLQVNIEVTGPTSRRFFIQTTGPLSARILVATRTAIEYAAD